VVQITQGYGETHAEELTAMDAADPVWQKEGIWNQDRWSAEVRPSTGTKLENVFDLSFAVEDPAGKPAAYIYTTHGQKDYPVTERFPGPFIFRLSVRQDQKGRRLGPLLLLASARAAQARGLGPYVTLETDEANAQANHVYRSLGFKEVGKRKDQDKGVVFVEYAVPIDELIEKAEAQVAARYGPKENPAAGAEEAEETLGELMGIYAVLLAAKLDDGVATWKEKPLAGGIHERRWVLEDRLISRYPEEALSVLTVWFSKGLFSGPLANVSPSVSDLLWEMAERNRERPGAAAFLEQAYEAARLLPKQEKTARSIQGMRDEARQGEGRRLLVSGVVRDRMDHLGWAWLDAGQAAGFKKGTTGGLLVKDSAKLWVSGRRVFADNRLENAELQKLLGERWVRSGKGQLEVVMEAMSGAARKGDLVLVRAETRVSVDSVSSMMSSFGLVGSGAPRAAIGEESEVRALSPAALRLLAGREGLPAVVALSLFQFQNEAGDTFTLILMT